MAAKSNVICFVPSCYFALAAQSFSSSAVEWGAQNSFPQQSGAHTGELSAEMIKGFGGAWVLVGTLSGEIYGETDSFIGQKLVASLKAGLKAFYVLVKTNNSGKLVDRITMCVLSLYRD